MSRIRSGGFAKRITYYSLRIRKADGAIRRFAAELPDGRIRLLGVANNELKMSNQTQFMQKEHLYYIYIATNHPRHTVLYTGVTNSLFTRSTQHKEKLNPNSFTARYNVNKIVYYEIYGHVGAAIYREKQIKGWIRKKKIELINSQNPRWTDVVEEIKNADD